MKHLSKILFSLALLLICQSPALARDKISDWYIKDLQAEITVNKDSSLDITENILADCGNLPDKHGIFRVLPKNYKTKTGNFILPLELISITDKAGNNLKYSISNDKDTVTYKIGDADVFVQGENFYQIKYRVKNALRTENTNFDELYWNVLGTYWDLEIDKFTAQINFPLEINQNNTTLYFYTGELSSKKSDLITSTWIGDNVLKIENNRPILKKDGITLSASFPKNIATPYELTFKDQFGFSVLELLAMFLLPLLIFIICFIFWNKYGRDINLKRSIVPEFEIPEKLSPMEMGGIINKGGFSDKAVTATIIRLGFLGYLKIESEKDDLKLIRTDKLIDSDLYAGEKLLLTTIFKEKTETTLKNLGNPKLSLSPVPKLDSFVSDDLKARGIIDASGTHYQIKLVFVWIVIVALAAIFPFLIWSSVVSTIIIIIFLSMMSRLTMKGAELKFRIDGFKLYMDTAETYRSRFQEKEGILDKLLPYAILFGITKEWLAKMRAIYGERYFENYHPAFMLGALNVASFDNLIDNIDQISNDVASAISPASSGAAGGGMSGGGGGGGGGGGW